MVRLAVPAVQEPAEKIKGEYMAGKIEVMDYDPQWAKLFKAESKKIKAVLGKNCAAVHHIGPKC